MVVLRVIMFRDRRWRPEWRDPGKYKWWGSGLGYGHRRPREGRMGGKQKEGSGCVGPREMNMVLNDLKRLTGFRPPVRNREGE